MKPMVGRRLLELLDITKDAHEETYRKLAMANQGFRLVYDPVTRIRRRLTNTQPRTLAGSGGVGEAPNADGNCPLSFLMASSGSNVGSSVVTAITVLASDVLMDISAKVTDDPSDSVDSVAAFVDSVVANPTAGAPCASGLTAVDKNGDGKLDTFVGVKPGTHVCFDVISKKNVSVPGASTAQTYKASISVLGSGVTVLSTRNVFFLVPSSIE